MFVNTKQVTTGGEDYPAGNEFPQAVTWPSILKLVKVGDMIWDSDEPFPKAEILKAQPNFDRFDLDRFDYPSQPKRGDRAEGFFALNNARINSRDYRRGDLVPHADVPGTLINTLVQMREIEWSSPTGKRRPVYRAPKQGAIRRPVKIGCKPTVENLRILLGEIPDPALGVTA